MEAADSQYISGHARRPSHGTPTAEHMLPQQRTADAGSKPQAHEHGYLRQPPRMPDGARRPAFLVAVVTSPASHPVQRSWVRSQWARNEALLREALSASGARCPDSVLKFAVGINDQTAGISPVLLAEEQAHGDILVLHSVKDLDNDAGSWHQPSATTEKVLYGMQWAVEHYNFRYFARLGDDSYFRLDEFYRQAQAGAFPSSMAAIGFFVGPYEYRAIAQDWKSRFLDAP